MLYTSEGRQDELTANIIRDRPEIEKAVKKACKLLNKLTPDGALYASAWVLADLIVSLMPDEEKALELSRIVQGQIEREFKIAYPEVAPAAMN
ncbi:hypothetical protein [Mesorhizobium sp. M1365]|uniref:hypothetical protein n=1 Tax=Mesorhizobium sp. M1365 TaxID=2957090 RepID=UPI0033373FAC